MQSNFPASGAALRHTVEAASAVAVTGRTGLSGFARLCAISLSLTATCTSAWISTVAGWERGGQDPERVAWVLVGLVLLLSAHLIPALSRGAVLPLRAISLMLWALAMVATGYTHATFFITAQEHAGEARAAKIAASIPPEYVQTAPTRDLDQIAVDRAQVERDLAVVNAQQCHEKCAALGVRRVALNAKLTALNIEVDEAKRQERSADQAAADRQHVDQLKTSALADPVTYRLAALMDVSTGEIDLGMALSFGWLLEAVACLGWLLALPRKLPPGCDADEIATGIDTPLPNQSNALAGESNAVMDESNGGYFHGNAEPHDPSIEIGMASEGETDDRSGRSSSHIDGDQSEMGPDLRRLLSAIERGETRRTVKDIRRYLRCSQEKAQSLRREIENARYMEVSAR